jgi:hypothetical protein
MLRPTAYKTVAALVVAVVTVFLIEMTSAGSIFLLPMAVCMLPVIPPECTSLQISYKCQCVSVFEYMLHYVQYVLPAIFTYVAISLAQYWSSRDND